MRFPALVLFLCSLIGGVFLFSVSFYCLSRENLGGYAALALGQGAPDREIALALEQALGRPVLSESSQWVFLNSFNASERIPLDEYDSRLEPFDPRRDGYAEKLRNFFVRDGKRWFFIPLDREFFGLPPVFNPQRVLEKRIAAALGTVSGPAGAAGLLPLPEAAPGPKAGGRVFSLELWQPGRPLVWYGVLFGLAWILALALERGAGNSGGISVGNSTGNFGAGFRLRPGGFSGPAARSRRREGRRLLLLLAPMMFPLALWGAPGLALAALFVLLGSLAAEPLRELWARTGRPGTNRKNRKAPSLLKAGTYRFRVGYCLLLVPFFFVIPWIGGIPPLPAFLNLAGLGGLYALRLSFETRRKFPRFVPLPILSSPAFAGKSAVPWPMLPFALASCLALFIGSPGPGSRAIPGAGAAGRNGALESFRETWPFLVREEDYQAHVKFQMGFSRRAFQPLTAGGFPGAGSGYFHYTVGEDGLVAGVLPAVEEPGFPWEAEIPPFPLADLSNFLASWEAQGASESGVRGFLAGNRVSPESPLIPLLVFLPVLLSLGSRVRGRGGWRKTAVYDDKRVAA
jgi:hypothetical protein